MKNFEKIAAYIGGKMTQEEKEAFELAIASNKGLAMEVEMQKLEEEAIVWQADENLRKQIKEFSRNNPVFSQQEKKQMHITWRKWAAIAASLFLLVSAYFVFNQNPEETPKEIAVQFYKDNLPKVDVNRTPSQPQPDYLPFAISIAFANPNEIGEAIEFFENIQPETPLYPDAVYWLGHACFKKRDFNCAILKFSKVKNITNRPELLDRATFYTLLSHLAFNGITPESVQLLQVIRSSQSNYSPKADSLYSKLKPILTKD